MPPVCASAKSSASRSTISRAIRAACSSASTKARVTRTATRCCPSACWLNCAPIGRSSGLGPGCSQAPKATDPWPVARPRNSTIKPDDASASSTAQVSTPCAIRSAPTCSTRALIHTPFNSCSAIAPSRRRSSISIAAVGIWCRSPVRSIYSVSRLPISPPWLSETGVMSAIGAPHMPSAPADGVSRLEVADILRRFGPSYAQTHSVSPFEQRLIDDLTACRTARLGGHTEHCPQCGFERQAYNSCRNRHCPKCQTVTKMPWVEARRAELLPTPYFHTVLTLPHELNLLVCA